MVGSLAARDEDPTLQVCRREQGAPGGQRLGSAQHEKTVRAQREPEPLQDLELRVDREVHQRVATGQEVYPRDGRVAQQIVTTEYHGASQFRTQGRQIPDDLEVASNPLLAQRLEHHGMGERGMTSGSQRLVVDVGGVELHPVAERGVPHRLRKEDHDGEGLLSARAPRHPHAYRVVRTSFGQDVRDDGASYFVPSLTVTEEARDVDEDGVEELV